MKHFANILGKLIAFLCVTTLCPADDGKSELPDAGPLAAPVDPSAFRVLFVGNSITRHGTSPEALEKLKWDHVAGMAASVEAKDFAHTFIDLIQPSLAPRKATMKFASLVPGGEGTPEQRLAPVKPRASEPYDLVIIQFGEHEKEANGIEAAKATYEELVSLFLAAPGKPMILCVGNWVPGSAGTGYTGWGKMLQDAMREICKSRGLPFVSVEEIAMDPANRGWGEHPGVKWHPNDCGHQLYADKLFKAYETETAKR